MHWVNRRGRHLGWEEEIQPLDKSDITLHDNETPV